MDSPLPNKPDRKLVEGLCVEIYLHELCHGIRPRIGRDKRAWA